MTVLKVEKTASRWLDFSSASKFPSIPFDDWQSWQHDINRFSFPFPWTFLSIFQDLEIWLTQSFFPLELSLFNWQGEKWSQQYMGNGYYGICLCFQKVWWISNLLIFSNIFDFRKAKQTFYVTHLIREGPRPECYHSNILWLNLERIFEYFPIKEGSLPASDIFYIICDQMSKGYLYISQQRKGLCQQVIFSL